jgi:hypothetical protein
MKLSEAQIDKQVIVQMARRTTRRGIIRGVRWPDAIHPSGYIHVYVAHWLGESFLANFHPDDVEPVDAPEEDPEEAPE